ncbi:MBL fold metallo-hydrolase [Catalinimonas sp. 4WD22]|uniref:MBL fold metallo-hydrolase n=1 Tax=Catalinimonas locisalis TaxID=3133978 RepID=UPI0031011B0B
MINTLDLNFLEIKRAIASFLLETSEGPVLFETGPYSTFPHLVEQIKSAGYAPTDIKHVFLTHIHFDHAGAAWAFAKQGAKVYVHPFGLKHLANPEKLWNSAKQIYKHDMERLWGDMQSIPEEQLKAVEHEETISIGDTQIKAWHTPGHAVHHIAWQVGDIVFTGDVAGVRVNPENQVVEPPCPPPDINVEDWLDSIKTIRELKPQALYLTHFGKIEDINWHLDELEKRLIDWSNWIKTKMELGKNVEETVPQFKEFVANQLKDMGVSDNAIRQYEAANPSYMSVAGLMRYWKKKKEREQA